MDARESLARALLGSEVDVQSEDPWEESGEELHPDVGGNAKDFEALKRAAEQAVAWFTQQDGGD